MAVVHKIEIRKRLEMELSNPKSLVITPLLQEERLMGPDSDIDSVDLRLGTFFLLPQVPPEAFFYPNRKSALKTPFRIHVPMGDYLVIPAHQTVLGSTLEFIKFPCDLAGQILTKSSVARTFMVIETAPWIHPSYRGCLTLEIANVSNTPLLLYPGTPIGQLIFLEIKDAQLAKSKLRGSYLGPVYPEAPTFADTHEVLETLGIKRREIMHPGSKRPMQD